MRRLALLRHAKAKRGGLGLPDRDRPLSRRGRHAAALIGAEMARIGFAPDLVLCSPARRARETWELAGPHLPEAPEIRFEDRLYDGDEAALLDLIREAPGAAHALLAVGHNPTLADLAARLAATDCDFPTGALAVMEFPIDAWPDLGPGSGRLTRFATPRMLDA